MGSDESGAAPANAFRDEYAGTDFDWFAADVEGNIGIFFNDSFGFVPEAVQASYQAHARLAQELEGPYAGSMNLARNMANEGLFVFSWSGQWEPYSWSHPSEPYEQVAQPARELDAAFKARILRIEGLPVLRQNLQVMTSVSPADLIPV